MKKTWLIDAGHGGLDANGKYTTDPKIGKQYTFDDGLTIYEGVVNRLIAQELHQRLALLGIEFKLVYDEVFDTGLTQRATLANKLHVRYGNCVFISLHSNAGHGKGFEVFTSPGQTKSDVYAEKLINVYKKHFPQFPMRSDLVDGDGDKEARFTVITKTIMPAMLIENLFFDTRSEADFLLSALGRTKIVEAIVEFITQIENE